MDIARFNLILVIWLLGVFYLQIMASSEIHLLWTSFIQMKHLSEISFFNLNYSILIDFDCGLL